jgi:hypothetical protein
VPPDAIAPSGVVVIGPDQELQALAAELEVRREFVDGSVATFRCSKGSGVHAQLNNNRPTIHPAALEVFNQWPGLTQRGVPNDDAGAGLPGLGRLVTRENHDTSA